MIATATITLSAGQSKTIELTLNAAGRKLMRFHPPLKAALTEPSGTTTLKSGKVTLVAPKGKHR
ncbi:MAG: hypothetical protein M3071_11855 [Actinomycetota bacterium]|nr:hypothetical protein [Actinomycetota bacterium]